MTQSLPSVEVIRKFIDTDFDPRSPVLVLDWSDSHSERLWELPMGLCVVSAPPRQFALQARRHEVDSYAVRLRWDGTLLSWPALSRVELLGSCLSPLLSALGLDLWSLLEQPIPSRRSWARAA
jgi:hypothetical protein